MASLLTLYYNTPSTASQSLALHASGTWEIAMNDLTGPRWTPQAAPFQPIYGGSAPFRDGAELLGESAGLVSEQIPLQITAATPDLMLAELRTLRQILRLGALTTPVILKVQPNAHSQAVFFEVVAGDVQEGAQFTNDEAGRKLLRCVATVVRQPFGTADSLTNIATQTGMKNSAGGSPTNFKAFANLGGDLMFRGQPLRVECDFGSTTDMGTNGTKTIYVATALAPNNYSRGDTISTTSTSPVAVGSPSDSNAGGARGSMGLKTRIVGRVRGSVANLEMRVVVSYGSATYNNGAMLWTSPWVAIPAGSYGTTNGFYADFGGFALPDTLARMASSPAIRIQPQVRSSSTTGGTATGTLDYLERISYATWCRIDSSKAFAVGSTTGRFLWLRAAESASAPTTFVRLFPRPDVVWIPNDNLTVTDACVVRGTLPVAIHQLGLYAAWMNNNVHVATSTMDVAGYYTQLFQTLRGNG